MNSYTCACGKIRGELNKTNWTRHLQSCGKKRKLSNYNHTSVTNTNTTLKSFLNLKSILHQQKHILFQQAKQVCYLIFNITTYSVYG